MICVDWEAGASLPNYVRASANTRLIGKQLSFLMKDLVRYKKLELSHVHIIGFSLGAHVSGFAGSELPGLKRITGKLVVDGWNLHNFLLENNGNCVVFACRLGSSWSTIRIAAYQSSFG